MDDLDLLNNREILLELSNELKVIRFKPNHPIPLSHDGMFICAEGGIVIKPKISHL